MSNFWVGFQKHAVKNIPVAKVLDYSQIAKETSKIPMWKRKLQETATKRVYVR